MSAQLALLPQRRFWVVTLAGIRNRGTFGPFPTERAAGEWAEEHERPTSSFITPPVRPPLLLDGDLDA